MTEGLDALRASHSRRSSACGVAMINLCADDDDDDDKHLMVAVMVDGDGGGAFSFFVQVAALHVANLRSLLQAAAAG